MADNISEVNKNPLKQPRIYTNVNPELKSDTEKQERAIDLARQGGSGGKGLGVPTIQRTEQIKYRSP
ncbi:MAG: hypothetical protein ABIJ05_00345 [Patescibacteria group bacterium]